MILSQGFHAAAQDVSPAGLYIANDWPMLPIAAELARRTGAIYIYDSHELAAAEYADSRKWRLVNLPYVRAVEARYIGGAATTLTVSQGIAETLQRLYGLAEQPTVIRNMPGFREVARHVVDPKRISVVYHGLVAPGRGLEALVTSVPAWREEFRLTIRGPASPAYGSYLREIAVAGGSNGRIEFAPSVKPDRLIDEAAKSDIGIFALPGDTLHATLALPNKFFDYVMAGLALCIADLPEMAALVRRYELGRLIKATDATAIAASINSFDTAAVEKYRTNALHAARELNWQNESHRFVAICERALGEKQ